MNERILADPARVDAARAGDDGALEEVLRAVWPHAYRVALSLLRHPASAEDAAQNACAVILHALPGLRDAHAFGVWTYRIVVREALALERRTPRHDPLDPDAFVSRSGLTDADVRIDVLNALAKLASHERAAVTLYYYADATSADIAAILGMPGSTVRYHLMNARRKLEGLLDVHRPLYHLKGAVHAER